MVREFFKKGLFKRALFFIIIANFILASAPISYASTDTLRGRNAAARGADSGFITDIEHAAVRRVLERLRARNPSFTVLNVHSAQDRFGRICIQVVPGMTDAILEETEGRSFIRGHYMIRPDENGITYLYIDKDTYYGGSGTQYSNHEYGELERIRAFAVSRGWTLDDLAEWLDNTGDPKEVQEVLTRIHNEAPPLPKEGSEIAVDSSLSGVLAKASQRPVRGAARFILGKQPSAYGPHPLQEGLQPLYERIAWARKNHTRDHFKIKSIYAFRDQKHGMAPTEAISFGMVLGDDHFIVHNAPVMGGISAGGLEPATHPNIKAAIDFFNKYVSPRLVGLSIAGPHQISEEIIQIDEEFRGQAQDKTQPRFSYIGAEIAVGISMISTIALAEELHVPVEVVINYRNNEIALSHGLAREPRLMSIPVNFGVVWEGGKHGVAKYLPDLVREGIIKDDSRFPDRFKDAERIRRGDKTILLAMVPPQELQVLDFAREWDLAYATGVKLTGIYQRLLNDNGIKTKYGAESGFTTEQTHTAGGELITLELVLGILEEAVDSLEPDEEKYVRYALDIAASEMYIPEIGMYYIGSDAARRVDPNNVDGLVTNEQFTQYKLMLFKEHPRFISCEDWAADDRIDHWDPSAKSIKDRMIQMGDDLNVSRADLIARHNALGIQNAHLHKPNQASEEEASMLAVATSHRLGNAVVWSHRGTRSPQETFTAQGAIGTGSFGGKFTLWGPGRSALIAAMTQADALYKALGVNVPYQGGLVLDPNGPYKDVEWAKRLREEVALADAQIARERGLAQRLNVGLAQLRHFNRADEAIYSATGRGPFRGFINEVFDYLKKNVIKEEGKVAKHTRALIIGPNFFKVGGAKSALNEVARLSSVLKIAVYGESAERLKILLGNENIISGESLDDVLEELSGLDILPEHTLLLRSPEDKLDEKVKVRQLVAGDLTTLALAKAVQALFSGIGEGLDTLSIFTDIDLAFSSFFREMRAINVISDEVYLNTFLNVTNKLEEGKVFELPELKPTQTQETEAATKASRDFVEQFI